MGVKGHETDKNATLLSLGMTGTEATPLSLDITGTEAQSVVITSPNFESVHP